jgi:hypothetical protein
MGTSLIVNMGLQAQSRPGLFWPIVPVAVGTLACLRGGMSGRSAWKGIENGQKRKTSGQMSGTARKFPHHLQNPGRVGLQQQQHARLLVLWGPQIWQALQQQSGTSHWLGGLFRAQHAMPGAWIDVAILLSSCSCKHHFGSPAACSRIARWPVLPAQWVLPTFCLITSETKLEHSYGNLPLGSVQ